MDALSQALRGMRITGAPLFNAELSAGYESEAAFNRAFKREFDLPPARYRRRQARVDPSAEGAIQLSD